MSNGQTVDALANALAGVRIAADVANATSNEHYIAAKQEAMQDFTFPPYLFASEKFRVATPNEMSMDSLVVGRVLLTADQLCMSDSELDSIIKALDKAEFNKLELETNSLCHACPKEHSILLAVQPYKARLDEEMYCAGLLPYYSPSTPWEVQVKIYGTRIPTDPHADQRPYDARVCVRIPWNRIDVGTIGLTTTKARKPYPQHTYSVQAGQGHVMDRSVSRGRWYHQVGDRDFNTYTLVFDYKRGIVQDGTYMLLPLDRMPTVSVLPACNLRTLAWAQHAPQVLEYFTNANLQDRINRKACSRPICEFIVSMTREMVGQPEELGATSTAWLRRWLWPTATEPVIAEWISEQLAQHLADHCKDQDGTILMMTAAKPLLHAYMEPAYAEAARQKSHARVVTHAHLRHANFSVLVALLVKYITE